MDEAFYLSLKSNQIVLFADILGFSNLVMESENNTLNDSTRLMIDFEEVYYAISERVFHEGFLDEYGIKFKFVSDSIIISTDLDNVVKFILSINVICMHLLCYGLALRGGIAIGRLYHEKNIWGVPMVKAVKMEGNIAVMPRIVISAEDLNLFYDKSFLESYFHTLEHDSNYLYFDFFAAFFEFRIGNTQDILFYFITFASQIRKRYDAASMEGHKIKWMWLAKRLHIAIENYQYYIEEEIRKSNHSFFITITEKELTCIEDLYEIVDFSVYH